MSRLGLVFVLASAFAFAESWTGELLDADCVAKNASSVATVDACTPTSTSSSFVLEISNTRYTLDQAGNRKAADAFKKSQSGAARAKNPDEIARAGSPLGSARGLGAGRS